MGRFNTYVTVGRLSYPLGYAHLVNGCALYPESVRSPLVASGLFSYFCCDQSFISEEHTTFLASLWECGFPTSSVPPVNC